MTRTRRTGGNASYRRAKARMEAHEVQEKNKARAKRTAKVNRQSSRCRFSNCSKREEMAARWSACFAERPAVCGARWLSSCMKVDGPPRNQVSPAWKAVSLIVGTPAGFQQSER